MLDKTNKVSQIFEYLLAVKNINEKIIRNVSKYEDVWWQNQLPNGEGCFIGGSGTNDNAWLEVHKQELPPVPSLPQILNKWVNNRDHHEKEPTPKETRTKKIRENNEEVEIVEKFEDSSERVKAFDEWFKKTWRPWAQETVLKKRIQKLYMGLFTLHQRFQREGDEIELVWGHGLISWYTEGEFIERPILVSKLELQFDAKKGIFTLSPTSKGTYMETDMLNNINFPNAKRLQEMERDLGIFNINPWDEELIAPFLQEVVHTISAEGKYIGELPPEHKKPSIPIISYSPVLFLRKLGGRLWQNELTTVIERLKDGYPIPDTLKVLTTTEKLDQSINASEQLDRKDSGWTSVGEDLLFPLPANNEQKLIAQKIAASPGIVVQGPPGTGKSHTIANLICHLLAHGKRVLITSEKERALKVLRDKIPDEVRSLCVSLLGGDSRSLKEVEQSIKHIAENMDRMQPEILEKNIHGMKSQLYETRKSIAKLKYLINQAAELENKAVIIDTQEITPLEIGKWLNENEQYNWIPDSIKLGTAPPLTNQEMDTFFTLLGTLRTEDIEQLKQKRPSLEVLPSPSSFEKQVQYISGLENIVSESEANIKGWDIPATIPDLKGVIKKVLSVIEELKDLEEPWLQVVFEDVFAVESRRTEWEEFVEECRGRIQQIEKLDQELIDHEIQVPKDINEITTKEDLDIIYERMKENKGVGWYFKKISGRKYAYLFDGLLINDLPIRNKTNVEVLIKYFERNETKKKLVLKWNRIMLDIDGEQLSGSTKRFTVHVDNLLKSIEKILKWKEEVIEPLQEKVSELGMSGKVEWSNRNWFESFLAGLQALEDKEKWNEANIFFRDTSNLLTAGKDTLKAHSSWTNLFNACQSRDIDKWDSTYKQLMHLGELEKDFYTFEKLQQYLYAVTPNWVNKLMNQDGDGTPIKPPEDWKTAWKWSQCNNWLNNLQAKTNIEELELSLELEQLKESRLIKELVAESTWMSQIKRTTKAQKTSLHAWLNATKRIGKGTGKYAGRYIKEASEEMKTSRGAIPVWIMPIQKVIENIQLTGELFDVVIVDESSQSDLFSLSALLRAKKAVIVGDDNQISPESVGTDLEEVHQLIDRFLTEIPHHNRYETKTSLYDITNQVFDHKIVLKEHFRCVPEIIQFSNDLMYGGKMDPLRLPMAHEMLAPAIQTIRVPEGFRDENTRQTLNQPEAEAIVSHIVKCCGNPQYENRTIGVISLQGHDQAKLIESLLRDAIGEEEMINRKLICGDAYSFQGDERDVIILSMVAANNVRIGPLVKTSDMQRFNVAASRARDQMILFHSVDLKDLNPNCMRYRLLQYCIDPHRVQEEMEEVNGLFDSEFERDVYRLIAARGYRIIPQVKVGSVGKRIDLVVEGMRNRLAVECDGDRWHGLDKWEDDMERQGILERVGWTFWRVRGSTFYRDPERSMEPLWERLKEMDIQPQIIEKESAVEQQQPEEQHFQFEDLKEESIVTKETEDALQTNTAQELTSAVIKDSTDKALVQKKDDVKSIPRENNITEDRVLQLTLDDYVTNEKEIRENFNLEAHLSKLGLEVIDKRPPGGVLWVIGGIELSHIMKDLAERGYLFTLSASGGKATNKRVAWYMK